MATILNAVSGIGLTQTPDSSGVMKVQSNGVTTNALAWVNFDGTLTGTITPRANYNISSVTKNGTGDYTLNFTNILSDANYSYVVSVGRNASGYTIPTLNMNGANTSVAPTTLSARFSTLLHTGASFQDSAYINVVVFGN